MAEKILNSNNNYYIYAAYVDGVIRYIGKGKGSRYKHCNSGKSSCTELNRDFFLGSKIEIIKLKECLSEAEALELETAHIICNKDTLYNKQIGDLKVNVFDETNLVSFSLDSKDIIPITSIKGFVIEGKEYGFNHSDKLIYLLILSLYKNKSPMNISQEYLAAMFGMSIKGVRDCISRLKFLNLIEITKTTTKGSVYAYTPILIDCCDFEMVVYPDYSKELKTTNMSNLNLMLLETIRKY